MRGDNLIPQMRMEPFGGLGTGVFHKGGIINSKKRKEKNNNNLYQIRLLFDCSPYSLTVYQP